jgi:UPF0716 protein FxsA
MLFWLVSIFVLTPLVELVILVYIGMTIGAGYTVLIVAVTGLAGAALAKNQGLATLSRARSTIEGGAIPSGELLEGALILAGGLMLVTPGVLTDIAGLVLLIPQTRRRLGSWLGGFIRSKIESGAIQYWEGH